MVETETIREDTGMDFYAQYKNKLVSVEEAVLSIQSGETVAFAQAGSCPNVICQHMTLLKGHATNVHTYLPVTTRNYPFMNDPAYAETFDHTCGFMMQGPRQGYQNGMVSTYPNDLHSGVGRWIEVNGDDVFITGVAPMDEHGYFCMPLSLIYERTFFERAKRVIVEVNPRLPRVWGDTMIHISQVDMIVEAESPVETLPESRPTEKDQIIGSYVASLVNDGDTIQLGIGGIPDAVAHALLGKHDLGIHSEMLCNSMVDLVEAGVVTGRRKTYLPGMIVGTFALGSQRLYDMLNNHPMVRLFRGDVNNDPRTVSRNDNFVAINSAVNVDLSGQICAESIGSRQYSGSGGQFDMNYGALHSKGGRSIIALPSTQKDGTVSTITAQLIPGSAVTTSRNTIDYVVTEFGIAPLTGRSLRRRVDNLIEVAHPDFRAELRRQAQQLMLW